LLSSEGPGIEARAVQRTSARAIVAGLASACSLILLSACGPEPESQPICIVRAAVAPQHTGAFQDALAEFAQAEKFRLATRDVPVASSDAFSTPHGFGRRHMRVVQMARRDAYIMINNPFDPSKYSLAIYRSLAGSAPSDATMVRIANDLAQAARRSGADVPPIPIVKAQPEGGGRSFCVVPSKPRTKPH
jgi:hypothetical protein